MVEHLDSLFSCDHAIQNYFLLLVGQLLLRHSFDKQVYCVQQIRIVRSLPAFKVRLSRNNGMLNNLEHELRVLDVLQQLEIQDDRRELKLGDVSKWIDERDLLIQAWFISLFLVEANDSP